MSPTNKKLALQRIRALFKLAQDVVHEDEELAQNYVAIARKVSMAARTRVPREYQRQICKNCKKFILPGVNCRVRIQQRREPHIVITCGYCDRHMRFPIKNRSETKNDYAKDET